MQCTSVSGRGGQKERVIVRRDFLGEGSKQLWPGGLWGLKDRFGWNLSMGNVCL